MGKDLFKVGFDITDYKDILPDIDEYQKYDDVMHLDSGDINDQVWVCEPEPEIITPDYIRQEVRRILKTGFWFMLKGEPCWLPPNAYFFYRYFNTGGRKPEFRLNRLMAIYHKIRVRQNPLALGTLVAKARQVGETTFEMSDALWEVAYMLNTAGESFGMVALQSVTRQIVMNSCWRTLIMGWNGIPKWLKDTLYTDFISGDKVAETMKFVKQSDEEENGKNVLIAYAAGSHNAFDSINNCRRMILDEWLKWDSVSPYATFLNYEKFIATGTSRKGLFSIFSSPADVETKYIKETYDFWMGSDPDKLNEHGTTDTKIFRYYASPLTGIEGFYDRWGDADANQIYDHIMAKRKSVPKEYQMGEIRAYPLSVEEIFGSFEGGQIFDNHKGIVNRKVYIINTRFKNDETKEPTRLYGNLEWKDGVIDSDVVFRMADVQQIDVIDARFVVPYPQLNNEPLRYNSEGKPEPPRLAETCLGIDPIDKRYVSDSGKGFSNAAMVAWKFRDFFDTGIVKCPILGYSCRPSHSQIFFEDAIKAAVYTRSMVQTENINSKIIDYFEDRGFADWMLAKRGEKQNSMVKGDAPSGKGMFLTEIIGLINSVTNTPLAEDEPYLLERQWIPELLDDLSKFNPKDTHRNDWTLAFGMSLFGAVKMLHKKVRQPSQLNHAVLDFLLT